MAKQKIAEKQPFDDKIYVRVICSICFGNRSNRNGGTCPYCDMDGATYIEATFETVKNQLLKMSKEDKKSIMECLECRI